MTAATKQSGSEVGNFVKAVLPRLISQPAQDAMKMLNVNLTDGNGNLRDIIQVYSEIANRMKGISETERIAVVEGLAGKYHISRMQLFLDDLASADSMYRSMYETSKGSAGLAMQENEKYMDSLQARINLVKVEFEKLGIAISEAFLTSGMVSFLEISGNVLNVFAKVTESVGILPVLLGIIGVGLVNLNKGFANTTMAIMSKVKALMLSNKTTTEATVIQGRYTMALASTDAVTRKLTMSKTAYDAKLKASTVSTQSAIVANTALSTSYKTLMASTGAGLAFVVAGFALEKLINHIGESQRKSEDLAEANKQLLSTYEQNEKEIDSLSKQYSQLNERISSGDYNTDDLAKYRDIQNELGSILPDLVTGEDQYGNKLIISADSVKVKTELLKEQLEIQKQLNAEQAKSDLEDSMELNLNSINEAKATIEDRFKMLTNGLEGVLYQNLSSEFKVDFVDSEGKPLIKTVDDLSSMIETLKGKLAEAKVSGNAEDVKLLELQISSMERYFKMTQSDNTAMINSTSKLKSDYISYANTIINENKNITDSNKEVATSFASELIKMADSSNIESVKSVIESMFKFDGSKPEVNGIFNSVIGEFEKLENASADTFEEVYNNVASTLAKLPAQLKELGLSESEISSIMNVLNTRILNSNKLFTENEQVMLSTGKTLADITRDVEANGDSVEELSESLAKQIEKLKELNTIQEQMVGVSEAQVSAVSDAIFAIETLGDVSERTASQENALSNSLTLLSNLYPHLTSLLKGNAEQREKAIKIIDAENKANMALIEAYKLAADGKLTAEAKATMGHLEETNKRIANINAEILALDKLQQKYAETINAASSMSVQEGASDADLLRTEKLSKQAYNKSALKLAELATLSGTQSSYASTLQTTVDAINEQEKASKKSDKATKESIYITDKYKQALEALNLEIEKQQAIQAKFPDHSKEHRKAVEAQIKLEKEKLALFEKQSAELQSQIKSGNILQTGKVSTESSTTKKLSGWNGAITSTFGSRTDNHRGIDIDGKMGDRLDANISGKVIASGSATSQGYHSSYGNIVVVQDSAGQKHIYAHLEKAIAKLGDTISAGTQIGTIGNSGNVYSSTGDGSHLHYEVNVNGQPIDPSQFITDAKSGIVSVINGAQEAIDNAQSDLNGVESDIVKQIQLIAELEEKYVRSNISYYDNLISGVDRSIQKTQGYAKQQSATSDGYRKQLEQEIKHHKYKQSLLHNQANYLREQIASGKLNANVVDELNQKVSELGLTWMEVKETIQAINAELINSKINEFQNARDGFSFQIELLQSQMDLLDENSGDYTKHLTDQLQYHKDIQDSLHQENEYIREQLSLLDLTQDELDAKTDQLRENVILWYQNEKSMSDIRKKLADDAIQSMKDAYAKQRDIISAQYDYQLKEIEEVHDKQMELYDEELKQFEKAHEAKVKMVDDEAKKYEESIRRKIDAIEKQRDAENHTKEVSKRQKEINKIQSRIDELALDKSYSAKAERADLEEQLAELKEGLSEYQTDREIELRKENLQNQLEAYQKTIEGQKEVLQKTLDSYKEDVEAKKKAENDKYEAERKRLENARKENERHFNELIANERQWATTREEIIKGNVENVKGMMQGFLTDFEGMNEETAKKLGISWQELLNLIDQVNRASGGLDNIPPIESSTPPSSDGTPMSNSELLARMKSNASKWSSASTSERQRLQDENAKIGAKLGATYHASSGIWLKDGKPLYLPDNIQSVADQMKANSSQWSKANATERKRLEDENKRLGSSIGATLNSSTGSWFYKGIPLYHDGGIVGDTPTNKWTDLANKMFNMKPNEQVIKSLKGELQIPPLNIANGFKNIQNLVNSIQTPVLATSTGDSGISINQMDVHISNVQGGEKGVKTIFDHIQNKIIKRGGR